MNDEANWILSVILFCSFYATGYFGIRSTFRMRLNESSTLVFDIQDMNCGIEILIPACILGVHTELSVYNVRSHCKEGPRQGQRIATIPCRGMAKYGVVKVPEAYGEQSRTIHTNYVC